MRVGFVLRSTEIKPLFHRFVPLMQKFFFRIHASCATLNISFTLERYWSSIITGLGVSDGCRDVEGDGTQVVSLLSHLIASPQKSGSSILPRSLFLFSRMPQGKIFPPLPQRRKLHDNINQVGRREVAAKTQCFNGIRATGVAKLHSEDSLPTVPNVDASCSES